MLMDDFFVGGVDTLDAPVEIILIDYARDKCF